MPIELSCTGCGRTLRVADDAAGKHARCPACGNVSRVPEPAGAGAAPSLDLRSHGVPSGYVPDKPQTSLTPFPEAPPNPFSEPAAKPSPYQSFGANPFGEQATRTTANPYAAPASHGYARPWRVQFPLASRGKRLGGYLLDMAVYIAASVPGFILVGVGEETHTDELAAAGGLLFLAGWLIVVAVNWTMIAQRGQSIAKRLLGMQMVRIDTGEPVGFVHGVILRTWVLGLAYGVFGMCILFTPFSMLLFLVDALLIFGDDRRCLHDLIAQTVVIDV